MQLVFFKKNKQSMNLRGHSYFSQFRGGKVFLDQALGGKCNLL